MKEALKASISSGGGYIAGVGRVGWDVDGEIFLARAIMVSTVGLSRWDQECLDY